jgi:protein-tyrosine phosphatase
MIDLHCHILPGVDDGARSLEEALEMARIAEQDGIKTIVATPHLFREEYADVHAVSKKREDLVRVIKENDIAVEILPGAEVHVSHNLIEEIRKHRENLVINNSSYMFVEFPAEHVFSGVKNLFFELTSEGLRPIIAHPERNSVFVQNPSLLYELLQMGGLSQCNSGSFIGLYGRRAEEAVLRFLDLRMIHFIASDGHGKKGTPPKLSYALRRAESAVGRDEAGSLVWDNPKAVVENRELPYRPEPVSPEEEKKSFRIKIPKIFSKNR